MSPLHLTGITVTDVRGVHWKIGNHIGSGGFGSIFVANDVSEKLQQPENVPVAIKVEPHDNGSLFTEMHFYHRCAKVEKMEEWQRQRGLDYVGMPRFHGSGSFVHKRNKYRFIVIDRFGTDLQTVLGMNDGKMPLKTALTVAIRVTDILEYIHFHGYVHKDVKAQNLLLGYDDPNKVYLVDFGLACRYFIYESGFEVHKEFREDMRRAHDGTIEFTSRDGHIGALSRRSDLEVLLYNLIYWISGKLPWSSNRDEADRIATQKEVYMRDPQELMIVCFGRKGAPPYILEFANYVSRLEFHEKPNYELCREMFRLAILKSGFRHDMLLQFEGGVVRVQTKRKCRKSYLLEKDKRQKLELDSQASLSGSSVGSVHTRLRSRQQDVLSSNGLSSNGNISDGNDENDGDDSSTSDRPSSVRRSCFDSRHSSGRRTGTNQRVEECIDQSTIVVDTETKESRIIPVKVVRDAQKAEERMRQKMMALERMELREIERQISLEQESKRTKSRFNLRSTGHRDGLLKSGTRPPLLRNVKLKAKKLDNEDEEQSMVRRSSRWRRPLVENHLNF